MKSGIHCSGEKWWGQGARQKGQSMVHSWDLDALLFIHIILLGELGTRQEGVGQRTEGRGEEEGERRDSKRRGRADRRREVR